MSLNKGYLELKTNPTKICEETVRVLVKIADNILKNPTNPKVRSLQKNNATIQSKIMKINGGVDCLKLMGFQETNTSFTLPSGIPLEKLVAAKSALLRLNDMPSTSYVATPLATPISNNISKSISELPDLQGVRRFIPPPFTSKFSNPFLQGLQHYFNCALAFNDLDCQKRAKSLIPLAKLESEAQTNLRRVQEKIKKEKLPDPEYSLQDFLLLELLTWFKTDFFTWVNSPDCERCGGKTSMSHMSQDPQDLQFTKRVEVFKCQTCRGLTKFPRYNDLNLLLETRRGRCGEWAQTFTLLCCALGWDARYVVDELDHVWTEVYSVAQKKWVHCDPCENACDTPLMYEQGWNKKLTYVMAYSPEEIQDVTWRYSSDHSDVLRRRKNCSETQLINAILVLRAERFKTFTASKRNYLNRRLVNELMSLMVERKPSESENQGRISGSKEWRSTRGESKSVNNKINMFIWLIKPRHIVNNTLTVQYSAALDSYQVVKGDGSRKQIDEWSAGVFSSCNIFRKEEKDWKTVYLARNENAEFGSLSWKFELDCESFVIDKVSIKFQRKLYENGDVSIKLESENVVQEFPKDVEDLESYKFAGFKHLTIKAELLGGTGKVAWQHAQLFRQATDSKECPFIVVLTFRPSDLVN